MSPESLRQGLLQTVWERLITKPEAAQAIVEHDESHSSYWLLTPFKSYAYWWSIAFAYFSGKLIQYLPVTVLAQHCH